MKIVYLSILVLFASCKTLKIRDLDYDTIPMAKSKIKQIQEIITYYNIKHKDSIMHIDNIIQYYDSNNNIIKEVSFIPNTSGDVIFFYKNGLLIKKEYPDEKYQSSIEWKYDNKKNVIEYKNFYNNVVTHRNVSVYGKNNNLLEKIYYHSNKKNSISKFEYDYKKRIVKIVTYDDKNFNNSDYVNHHFDKSGYIIKTEYIRTDEKKSNSFSSIIEYDDKKNIVKRSSYDNKNQLKGTTVYKYNYDKRGNMIEKNKYVNEKLSEKTIRIITYIK